MWRLAAADSTVEAGRMPGPAQNGADSELYEMDDRARQADHR